VHRQAALVSIAGLVPLSAGLVVAVLGAGHDAPTRAERPRLAVVEPGEENPGGTATTQESIDTREAFSHFSHGIGFEGEGRFKIGNAIFRRFWVSAPSSTESADGLGPLYNARGCQNCHLKDGRGRPPLANWPEEDAVSMFLRLSIPPETDEQRKLLAEHRANAIGDPIYGTQLQNVAVKGLDGEGHMHIEYADEPVTLADGTVVTLRKPTYSITEPAYGPLHPKVMMSPRIAPPMIGLGLLEAVPEEQIRANADPDDANKDGISGRTNEVWSLADNKVALGRFGWKSGTPSIRQQSSEAAAGDIGLSNPLVPHASGDCTASQKICLDAPNGNSARSGGLEIGPDLMDLVVFYSQNLAVPPRRGHDTPEVLRGKALFGELGCATCHHPTFTTGKVEGQPQLSNQKIWPYTDLLLHDMGDGLADNRPEGQADGREWRTAPLWGIGLTELVSGHTFFLHDGRARNVEEAILWHGGEAQGARDGYMKLSKAERDALIAFVNSL
jgi:CxxC motif-containing protein (DUF1111 family)